jgi:hypothetical protein
MEPPCRKSAIVVVVVVEDDADEDNNDVEEVVEAARVVADEVDGRVLKIASIVASISSVCSVDSEVVDTLLSSNGDDDNNALPTASSCTEFKEE